MIDSHCHINMKHFEDDFDAVLVRAVVNGVRALMNIGFDSESIRETVELVEDYGFILGVVGCHPHDAETFDDELERTIRETLEREQFIGIGEVGLDYYRDLSPRDVQETVFRKMIRLARERSVPIVVHCRDAFDDVIAILKDEAEHHRGIFHAFSGTPEEAQQIVDLGFHVGIGGVATFRNSRLARTIESLPLESIVLETDSPFLTPSPYRGKRNEPSYVTYVARAVARIKGMEPTEVSAATDENFCRAMGISPDMLPPPVYKLGETVYIHTVALPTDRLGLLDEVGEGVSEMVMCGEDETLVDLDKVLAIARKGRERGWRVRVNTPGGGNQLAGRDITRELAESVHEIVVLFHGTTAAQHDRAARTRGGESGFEIMKDFARCAVAAGIDTVCEFIATPKFDAEQCRDLAKALGAKYDIRMYRS